MLINDPTVPLATKADLVNASRILIQTPEGTKQLPADLTALASGFAPAFDAGVDYPAGTFVNYMGSFWRFSEDHAAGDWTGTDATSVDVGSLFANKEPITFTNRTYKQIQPNFADIVIGTSVLTWNTYNQYFHVAEIPVEKDVVYFINNCIMTGNTLASWAVVDENNVCLDCGRHNPWTNFVINCNDYPTGSKILLSNRYADPLKIYKSVPFSLDAIIGEVNKKIDAGDTIDVAFTAILQGHCSENNDSVTTAWFGVPKDAILYVTLPQAGWSFDKYTGTSYVFCLETLDENGVRTQAHGRGASNVSGSFGATRSITGKYQIANFFIRANVGESVSFSCRITGISKDFAYWAMQFANTNTMSIQDVEIRIRKNASNIALVSHSLNSKFSNADYSESIFAAYKKPSKRIDIKRCLRVQENQPSQGCAIYGNILFIMNQSYDGWMGVVDMLKNEVLQSSRQLTKKGDNAHNNALSFGAEKFDVGDSFPLLWMSSLDGRFLGYRITSDVNGYYLDLKQTISFTNFGTVFNNGEFDCYRYGVDIYIVGNKYGDTSKVKVCKLPDVLLSAGNTTLDASNVLDTFEVSYAGGALQGGFIDSNGVLFVAKNYGIICIDLVNKNLADEVSFSSISDDFEPEQLFVWDGRLYLSEVTKVAADPSGTRSTEICTLEFMA